MKSFFLLFLLIAIFSAIVAAQQDDLAAEKQRSRIKEKLANLQEIEDPQTVEAMMREALRDMAADAREMVKRVSPEEIEAHRKKVRERRERQRRALEEQQQQQQQQDAKFFAKDKADMIANMERLLNH